MTTPKRKLRSASIEMVKERAHAVEWVLDFIESTGGCRASFVSDRTKVGELLNDPAEARQAFCDLFESDFKISFGLSLPDFIDAIQTEFPDWPSDYCRPGIGR